MPALPALSRLFAPLAAAALTLASGPALAQQGGAAAAPASSTQSGAQARMPAVQTQGPLRYQCGGIGSDESDAMRAAMKDHPLSLLFARADGAYEANVQVRISPQGGQGEALSFTAAGPVCLLQLPAGSYQVQVQGAGQSHSRTVRVGGSPQTLDFRF